MPLEEDAILPVGTTVDTSDGEVQITSDYNGRLERMRFRDGQFRIAQTKSDDPIVVIRLVGPLACGPAAKGAGVAKRRKRGRRLWGSGKGNFRTAGRRGSATVRGTEWLTEDRCNGTTKFKLRYRPPLHKRLR